MWRPCQCCLGRSSSSERELDDVQMDPVRSEPLSQDIRVDVECRVRCTSSSPKSKSAAECHVVWDWRSLGHCQAPVFVAASAALCGAAVAFLGVFVLHVVPIPIGMGAVIGTLIVLSATPSDLHKMNTRLSSKSRWSFFWSRNDVDARASSRSREQDSHLHLSRRQRQDSGTERQLLLVSKEKWHAESEHLPKDCKPLNYIESNLLSDVLGLLSESEREPGARPKEALHPSTLVSFVRAYETEPDYPNSEKTAQRLRECLEERKMRAHEPQMEPKKLAQCRALWPRCVHGFDRQGHCILWDGVAEITAKDLQATFGAIAEGLAKRQLAQYERTFRRELDFLKRKCSEKYGFLVYRHVAVIDARKFHYQSIMVPGFLDCIKEAIVDCARLYPDTLERMYIINVHWLGRMGWSVIKQLIHPVTLSKIQLFGSDWMPKFMADTGLSIGDIPSSHGGSARSFKDLPMMCPVPANKPQVAEIAAR